MSASVVSREVEEAKKWKEAAEVALDAMAKPPGSLGLVEEWAARLCGLQRTLMPAGEPAVALIFAADHGVTTNQPVSSKN